MKYEEKFCLLLEAVAIAALVYLFFDLSVFTRRFAVSFDVLAICKTAFIITAVVLFFRILDRYVDRIVPRSVDKK